MAYTKREKHGFLKIILLLFYLANFLNNTNDTSIHELRYVI